MRVYLLLLMLFLVETLHAQNLVPNPSFEVADSCPVSENCCPTIYGTGYHLGCKDWAQATITTPDYFHECDTFINLWSLVPTVGIPKNEFGTQHAFDGRAYAGAIIFNRASDYKEYIMTRIPPLEIDTPYEVSFYISLADRSPYAVDGFGVLFTTYGSPDTTTTNTFSNTPQVNFSSYGVVSDTNNWVKLSGIYVPDSNYTSLIIGSFKHFLSIDTLNVSNPKRYVGSSYYYYDKVTVQKLSTIGIPVVDNSLQLSVQPNPVRKMLTIFSNENINSVVVTNMLGQVVYQGVGYESKQVGISVGDFPGGMYVAKINGTLVKQFIKE